ncbi:MAG TPA: ABC transporter permease [Ktedonobacterales bacterium]|nr:ABC transporter permease [Ktedonobacterales bacterium]
MDQILSSLPALIVLVAFLAILAYAGIRVGPQFLIRRIAGLVFVLLGVTFIVFILGYFSPGTAIDGLCGQHCTLQNLANLQHVYGLDLPWYKQYGNFLSDLLHFNLGLSFQQRGQTVLSILGSGIPLSASVGLPAVILQVLIGVPLGILAAVRAGSRVFDTSNMSVSLILLALPTFVVIPFYQLLMVFLSLHNLPSGPISYSGALTDLIAPIILLALAGMGYFARLTRTTMLDVLNQDYVRTARAKGLTERVVIYRHAFRNALNPLVTAIGPSLAFIVGGAFFTEFLFNIPGIGLAAVNSISAKDMPTVQGTTIIVALAVVVMNLVVDLVYGLLDPRVKVA